MQSTVIPFRTQTNAPDYREPQIAKDWHEVVSDTASDCREDIARIRKAKALINLIEDWGDRAWDDIAYELQSLVIEPAEGRIKDMLDHHGRATCSEREEHEIDELVSDTKLRDIMACQPYRRPTPRTYICTLDFEPLHNAEVLSGLPLVIETAPIATASGN